jgi:hypothetical protein
MGKMNGYNEVGVQSFVRKIVGGHGRRNYQELHRNLVGLMEDQGVIAGNPALKIYGQYQKGKMKIKELDLIPSVSFWVLVMGRFILTRRACLRIVESLLIGGLTRPLRLSTQHCRFWGIWISQVGSRNRHQRWSRKGC